MSQTIEQLEETITGPLHGSTLKRVRNRYAMYERVANKLLARIDPVETQRLQELSSAVHDDLNNYPLPSDFKKLIDLAPVHDRGPRDRAFRTKSESLSAGLGINNKEFVIEANEGTKFLRLNWKDTSAVTFHTMDSLTSNGTIAVVGSATGLKANTLYKLSGTASVEFDLVASGDGVQGTSLTAIDVSDWDELAEFIVPVYFGSVSNLTSVSFIFGNDLTTNYWTTVAQTTQADGTAFRVGWNFLKFPWSTATETGTVDPNALDSFKLTIAATGTISNVRVDNILVSLGNIFDLKYYSQYLFKNSSGTWISKPTALTDSVVLSGTGLAIFQEACIQAAAHQMEGRDSTFDINFTTSEMQALMQLYRAEHPSEAKRPVGNYWSTRPFRRNNFR